MRVHEAKIIAGTGENMRKPLLFFLFFLMACSSTSAFEDTCERYPTGVLSNYWYAAGTNQPYLVEYPASGYHAIYFSTPFSSTTHSSYVYGPTRDLSYMSFTVRSLQSHCTYGESAIELYMTLENTSKGYSNTFTIIQNTSVPAGTVDILPTNSIVELVTENGRYSLYINGEYVSDQGVAPAYLLRPKIFLKTSGSHPIEGMFYLDDFSTEGSTIGTPESWTEYADNFLYSYRIQAYSRYPNSEYKLSMYSLSGDNAGLINEETLTSRANVSSFSRSLVGENTGLYMLELTRDNVVLRDTYFIYYLSANPQQFPEVLFSVETDTAAEIRDEDNNGGIISGGSSVYLYPDEKEDGYYNFTIDLSEPSYSRRVELTKIYNTTTLNGSILSYSGLTENYNVSRDSTLIGQTNGSDSWDNTVTWTGQDSYIYEFKPDLSLPGFWGYVKNSETQTAIKSATVSITNGTDTFYVYTDENGMYYQTQGIATGETYTVQAKKTNYESSNPYNLTTTAGATTRQDLYLSKASGSGVYYAPHDVGFTVLEYWYSGAGLPGISYTISSEDDGEIKTGTTDSKGMFTGSDMTGGTNYTIVITHDGKTYTEYVKPSLTEYTFVLNKEGVLHQYANSWLTLSYTENTNNVTIAYDSNKTITGASLTAIANNGTTVYSQTLTTDTGSFTFETGGEGDYTLNFHIQATDGDTASQSWGLSYPNKVPLFPDEYPAWLKNILFSGIVIVFLLSFGKAKNDIACGAVAILTSMGYIFEWFTCSFYFVVLVWIIALGAVFLHYKRTGGIG